MQEIDRGCRQVADAAEKMVQGLRDYDYPAIFKGTLITVDLSAFYATCEIRMYTFGAKSEARRAGQTASSSSSTAGPPARADPVGDDG